MAITTVKASSLRGNARDRKSEYSKNSDDHTAVSTWYEDESGRSQSLKLSGPLVGPTSILRHSSNASSLAHDFRHHAPLDKHVSFGDIEIHVHRLTLGDNPAVQSGPPVTIEWNASETFRLDLDSYEKAKPEPRPKESILLPRSIREEMLRAEGFSRGELREAAESASQVRQQRHKSSKDGRMIRQFQIWAKRIRRGHTSSQTRPVFASAADDH